MKLRQKIESFKSNNDEDDNSAPDTFVSWNKFLHLNALMKYLKGTKKMFIDMWMGFIDPYNEGFVQAQPLRILFEQLARGRYNAEPTLVSLGFCTAVIAALRLGTKNNIINTVNVRKAFENDTIDIELLNQTLKQNCEFNGISEILEKALYE